jgi:hypothetical protein
MKEPYNQLISERFFEKQRERNRKAGWEKRGVATIGNVMNYVKKG